MRFQRVEDAIRICRGHLDSTESRNTEIETYLVGYILAVIYAEYEKWLREAIATRAAGVGDAAILAFVRAAAARVLRSIKCHEIAGILGWFGEDCKTTFQKAVNNTPAQAAYDNIIVNRMSVAHASGTNMTLGEVEQAFTDSQEVLKQVMIALGLLHAAGGARVADGECAADEPNAADEGNVAGV